MNKELGLVIQALRISRGLTMLELELRADIAPSQLYYLESGKRNIGIRTFALVLEALDINLAQLLLEQVSATPHAPDPKDHTKTEPPA